MTAFVGIRHFPLYSLPARWTDETTFETVATLLVTDAPFAFSVAWYFTNGEGENDARTIFEGETTDGDDIAVALVFEGVRPGDPLSLIFRTPDQDADFGYTLPPYDLSGAYSDAISHVDAEALMQEGPPILKRSRS